MKTKDKLGVDADQTIVNSLPALNNFHNEKYGTNFTIEDYTHSNWAKIWGITEEQVFQDELEFCESGYHKNMELVEGAYEAMERLSKELSIVILTARSLSFEKYLFQTIDRSFAKHHFTEIFHLAFPRSYELVVPKWRVCVAKRIPMLIDDTHSHLIQGAGAGIHGILFQETPWNTNVGAVPNIIERARDWSHAEEIVEKKRSLLWKGS